MISCTKIKYQNYRKEKERLMKSSKLIQKKFRINITTNEILQKILSYKKVTMQSVMESLVNEYICKNFDALIKEDK